MAHEVQKVGLRKGAVQAFHNFKFGGVHWAFVDDPQWVHFLAQGIVNFGGAPFYVGGDPTMRHFDGIECLFAAVELRNGPQESMQLEVTDVYVATFEVAEGLADHEV
jgi:hypothetical protein